MGRFKLSVWQGLDKLQSVWFPLSGQAHTVTQCHVQHFEYIPAKNRNCRQWKLEAWCVFFCCYTTCTARHVTPRSLLPRLLQSEKQAINRLWWFFFSLSDTLRELCPLGTLYWKYFPSAWPLYLTGKSIETCLMWLTASVRPHDGVTSPTYHTYLLYACHEASQMGGKQTDGSRGRQKTKSGLSRNFYFSGEKLWQTEILFILISTESWRGD